MSLLGCLLGQLQNGEACLIKVLWACSEGVLSVMTVPGNDAQKSNIYPKLKSVEWLFVTDAGFS